MKRALVLIAAVASASLPSPASAEDMAVELTAPPEGALLRGTVALSATTAGPATSVSFDWSPDAGASWVPIVADSDGSDGWSASWDTVGATGPATLRAGASDGTSTVTDEILVTLDNTAPETTLSASLTAFSPNGDGGKDATTISVTLDETATLRVVVRRSGSDVRVLLDDVAASAGTTDVVWNGRIRSGGRLVRGDDGTYGIKARVEDVAGNVRTVLLGVRIDTHAPRIRWRRTSPDPSDGEDAVKFSFTVSDLLPRATVGFDLLDVERRRLARLAGRSVPTGDRSRGYDPSGSLPRGPYWVDARLSDAAGNFRRVNRLGAMRVHRSGRSRVYNRLTDAGDFVALTFDDCWSGSAWRGVLDVLERRGVRATFFCNGNNVDRYPATARRTIRQGHVAGSHSTNHGFLPAYSESEIRAKIRGDWQAWWDATHATTTIPYFRPPYGAWNSKVLRAAGAEGYTRTILWDVDPKDWQRPGASVIRSRVVRGARRGSIILLHAIPQTVDALDGIISGLRRKGLRPVTLPELFRRAG